MGYGSFFAKAFLREGHHPIVYFFAEAFRVFHPDPDGRGSTGAMMCFAFLTKCLRPFEIGGKMRQVSCMFSWTGRFGYGFIMNEFVQVP